MTWQEVIGAFEVAGMLLISALAAVGLFSLLLTR